MYVHLAESGIISFAVGLQIALEPGRPVLMEGGGAEIPDKSQLFLHAITVRLYDPGIIPGASAVLQVQKKRQAVFCLLIYQILQHDICGDVFSVHTEVGDLRIFHQPASVHASYLKGHGIHGLIIFFYTYGKFSVRADGHNTFLHIFFFHRRKEAMHHIHMFPAHIYINERQLRQLHFCRHVRISFIQKQAAH